MQRMKTTPMPPPRPAGSLLAGAMIGSTIMAMAAQAMLVGAGAALQGASVKRR
ncbi:MAG TPA: hypothetical protein VE690_14505 [Rhodopila sp.]|nr:hypothetical protein [Rhodopila sp.]